MAKKASTSSRRPAKSGKAGKQKSIGKSKFAAKRLAKRTAAQSKGSAKPGKPTARPTAKPGKPAGFSAPTQKRAPVRAAKKPTRSSTAPIAKGTKLGKGVVSKGVRVTPSAAAKGLSKASGPRARLAAAVQGLEATGYASSPQTSPESIPPQQVSQQNLLASATPPVTAPGSSDAAGKPKKQDAARARAFAIEAAQLIRDDKCEDVVVLDVRKRSSMTDFLVIGSGTSDRQMRSVLHHVEELGGKTGNPAVRTSVDERSTWILADFVDVMVHLFEPNTRSHYDLEMMWGDCDRVSWERPDQRSRDYAGLNS